MVLSLYVVHLAYETNRYVIPSDVFEGDEYHSAFCAGFLESLKYFNNCGIKLEAVMDRFSIGSLGDLDLSYLVERVEQPDQLDDRTVDLVNGIRRDFGREPLKRSSEPVGDKPANAIDSKDQDDD